jgi:hypothetical protein
MQDMVLLSLATQSGVASSCCDDVERTLRFYRNIGAICQYKQLLVATSEVELVSLVALTASAITACCIQIANQILTQIKIQIHTRFVLELHFQVHSN